MTPTCVAYRTCKKCLTTKPVEEFRSLGGRKSYECRACYNRLSKLGIKIRVPDIDEGGVLKRLCTKCQVVKPLEEFRKSKRCLNGRARTCKRCEDKGRKRTSTPEQRERNCQRAHKRWISDPEHRRKRNEYQKERMRADPVFKLRHTIANSINCRLRRRGLRKERGSVDLLGCSIEKLKRHLEAQFQPGMTWQNHGFGEDKWHIDHIKPCASFDLTDPEQQKQCFHYTNLQPLWQKDNMTKWRLS